jgi:hypothetical protein
MFENRLSIYDSAAFSLSACSHNVFSISFITLYLLSLSTSFILIEAAFFSAATGGFGISGFGTYFDW